MEGVGRIWWQGKGGGGGGGARSGGEGPVRGRALASSVHCSDGGCTSVTERAWTGDRPQNASPSPPPHPPTPNAPAY